MGGLLVLWFVWFAIVAGPRESSSFQLLAGLGVYGLVSAVWVDLIWGWIIRSWGFVYWCTVAFSVFGFCFRLFGLLDLGFSGCLISLDVFEVFGWRVLCFGRFDCGVGLPRVL